jgi:hypothetical protein
MRSEISKLRAISSLHRQSVEVLVAAVFAGRWMRQAHKLDEVARSTCSSRADVEANQPAMLPRDLTPRRWKTTNSTG